MSNTVALGPAVAFEVTKENANEHLRRIISAQAEAWGCKVQFRAAADGDDQNPLDVYAYAYRDDWNNGLETEEPGFFVQLRAFAIVSPGSRVDELVLVANTCVYHGPSAHGFEAHEWLQLPADGRVQAWSYWDHANGAAVERWLERDFADRAALAARRAIERRSLLVGGIERLARLVSGSPAWLADGKREALRTVSGASVSGHARAATNDRKGVMVSLNLHLGLDDALAILAMADALNRR